MGRSLLKVMMACGMAVGLLAHAHEAHPLQGASPHRQDPPEGFQGASKPGEPEPWLVDVFLDTTRLGDGITLFQNKDQILLPLSELCHLLAFPLEIDHTARKAKGHSVSHQDDFIVDLKAGRADIKNQVVALLPESFHEEGGDIFLSAFVMESLLPLKFEVDLRMSRLNLTPLKALPIQKAMARDLNNAKGLMMGQGDELTGEIYREPYRFMEWPMADIHISQNWTRHSSKHPLQGSFALGGDFLWMSSRVSASRDSDGNWRNRRASLFREDPRGEMLGFLHAQRLGIGSLQEVVDLDLVGSLPRGHGVWVDNFPVAYRSRFAAKTFRGELPTGWSVELFQNDALVGYQKDDGRGLYEFPDIPLRYGLNRFRLVFHGPFGELREEHQRFDIESQQVAPGDCLG